MVRWRDDWRLGWRLDWRGPDSDPSLFEGYGPSGVGTLVLDLEEGYSVTHEWITDVHKMQSGKERRTAVNPAPRQRFSGSTLLTGDRPREIRSLMARHAATAPQFLLALPHEAITLRADSTGLSVHVNAGALALCDWATRGQRAVVKRGDEFIDVVIQSKTVNSITLDKEPGVLGREGGLIMPTVPILLDPQQTFPRYPHKIERWEISAQGALVDFAPGLASLSLPGVFAGLTAFAREFGPIGNTRTLEIVSHPGAPPEGILIDGAGFALFRFFAGTTTVGDFVDAMVGASKIKLVGAPVDLNVVLQVADEMPTAVLAGGTDGGSVGAGAALTTYDGDGTIRPVWDRYIDNENTNADYLHSMTAIVKHSGLPFALATADEADWGRAVVSDGGNQANWQWFKLFLGTVKGPQKTWWLPTWRDDVTFVSKAVNTITIESDDGSDFFGWFPKLREHIQIEETNGTITRRKITAAVDNGDGTITLTIGVTLGTSNVKMISWLELSRFEKDEIAIKFDEEGFSI